MLGFLFGCAAPPDIDSVDALDEWSDSFEYNCDAVVELWTFRARLTDTNTAVVPVELSATNRLEVHDLVLEFRDPNGRESYALDVHIVPFAEPGTAQTLFSCNDDVSVELVVP